MTFTASSKVGELKELDFRWTVSAGTIAEGQGTPQILVQTNREMSGSKVAVTVKIDGLARNCPLVSTTAEINDVSPCGLPSDEYGKVSMAEELMRLDSAAVILANNSDWTATFIVFVGPSESKRSGESRRQRIFSHLVKTRRISRDRVAVYFSKAEKERTSVYVGSRETGSAAVEAFQAKANFTDLQ